jgi:hypothetical protein
VFLWNQPGAQAVHECAPLLLNEPAAHKVQELWPLPLYEPAGQLLQMDVPDDESDTVNPLQHTPTSSE